MHLRCGVSSVLNTFLFINDDGVRWIFDEDRHMISSYARPDWVCGEAELFWFVVETGD